MKRAGTDEINQILLELQSAVDGFDSKAVAESSAQLVKLMESSLAEHPKSFCRELQECVDEFDSDRTSELCKQLTDHLQSRDEPYPDDFADSILKTLQQKRLFSEMIVVADQLLQSGSTEPVIQKRYAQALINAGHFSAAITVLTQLVQECESEKKTNELAEAKGLLGRVYKQIYVNAAASGKPGLLAKDALIRSFDCYYKQYLEHPQKYYWHGINAVAVWHRAKKDGVEALPEIDIFKVAADILSFMNKPQKTDMWAVATAAEACLATNDYPSALGWLDKYVDDEYLKSDSSNAFEVGSTLRQFEEVWQLNDNDAEQSRILQVLRAALLKRKGGVVSLDSAQNGLATINDILKDKSFEAVLGSERFKSLRWLKKGFERSQGVCKFVDHYDEAFGTGFLMKSSDLNLSVPNEWVVLTNAHVISNDETEQRSQPKARSPEQAWVQFEAGVEPERKFQIDQILAWSPRHELDFSVLTLTEQGEFTDPYPIANALPLLENDQRIYLIGHPRGGQLSFSLYDNKLLDYEGHKVHYRSPSLGGSSGSPVFNEAWQLIGLHHAGGDGVKKLRGQPGTYKANEGLWIKSIISAIASKNST